MSLVVFTETTKYYIKGEEAELVDETNVGCWVKRISDSRHLVADKQHVKRYIL